MNGEFGVDRLAIEVADWKVPACEVLLQPVEINTLVDMTLQPEKYCDAMQFFDVRAVFTQVGVAA